ncbi:probable leucine-rich repeat receptor-like protein kinase At1g35710 [Hevea brasiliensis]|uniref:probable leucine-rich repeat receptor-like protein kinase At1g35710 n=1 Tax=Hevea brasiliensis TaxID=3981 RepID=UPI0025EEAED5|nr:probable leucine-rich repeat receptor-like protein kinase At1g35710 [Hevea brasiliensis]
MARFILENLALHISLVVFILLHSSLSVASDSTQEANALLKWAATLHNFKDSNISLKWHHHPKNATNSDPRTNLCNWLGISCNAEGRVETLNLTNASLNGTLHELSFSSFPDVANINLSVNLLYGTIPLGITQLSKLVYLHLAYNLLNRQLSSLVELALYTNNLDGHIPASVGNLTKMDRLLLYNNQLSGSIPPELGNLNNLVELYMNTNSLSGNKITGTILPEIVNAARLRGLNLSSNKIAGSIPKELGKLTSLVKVILNDNQLSDRLPSEFGSLTDLEYLDLSANRFNQSIPENIGNLAKLIYLNLNSFKDMQGLLSIDISYNELEGPILSNKAFQNASVEAFQGNKGLCGDAPVLSPFNFPINKYTSQRGHKMLFLIVSCFFAELFHFSFFWELFSVYKNENKI